VRWLADECVDAPLVATMRRAGHDVSYASEDAAGALDSELVARAHDEDRLLLTEDKDFGELVFRWRRPVPGIVLLRIEPEEPALKWTRLRAAIHHYGDGLFGRFTVIDERKLRSRPLGGVG
jgi:predicted nuclease of predicted toxin-antitoxin system